VEEAKTVETDRPLPQVAKPERKSLDHGHFVIEPAEPVLEFRRVVEKERTDSRPKFRSY
jgi:hypothetical protein